MLVNVLLLIVGFVLLIKGADFFVDGAASTAQNFKVPKILIGLTLVAFGTSAPELAVSIKSLASGSTDMVLGNVIGSNILNILLIVGIAALIKPVFIKDDTVKKELPLTMLVSVLLIVLFLDVNLKSGSVNRITTSDGIVLLLFFSIFVYYLISVAKSSSKKEIEKPQYNLMISILVMVLGLGGIIIGSNMVVNNAISISRLLHVSERIIALTIVAFGTSLPELVTTIVSAKKGENDLLVGNIIGSNIFNICLVLGIPVTLFGSVTPGSFNSIDLIFLVLSSVMLFVFSKTNKKITKKDGIVMLITFFVYYLLVFVI